VPDGDPGRGIVPVRAYLSCPILWVLFARLHHSTESQGVLLFITLTFCQMDVFVRLVYMAVFRSWRLLFAANPTHRARTTCPALEASPRGQDAPCDGACR